MSIEVQHRRDTRAAIMGVVPAVGELGYATDTKEVTLGDGSTPGGAWSQRKNQVEPLAVTGLTGAINNWAPAGYSLHTGALSLSATGACTITGLTGGVAGRVLKLYNTGANPITLQGNNAGSTAANRFSFADLTLHPNAGVHLLYDATLSLWFCLSQFDGSAGLLAANNLSDVASATTSRTNLGLGTAATQAIGISGATVPLLNGANTWSGAQTFAAALYDTAFITPPALNTDTNDWAPTGFATANIVRASASVPVNLTGLAGGTAGRRVTLVNVGAQNITLADASVSSLAVNRFNLATNTTLVPAQAVVLWYDATAGMWDCLATTSASASGGLLASNNLSDVASVPTSRTSLGLGSLATQNASTVTITGGTIDGAVIGGSVRAHGSFDRVGVGTSTPVVACDVRNAAGTLASVAISDTTTTAGANTKTFDFLSTNGVLYGRCVDDTYASATQWLTVNRTGATVGPVGFPAAAGVNVTGPLQASGNFSANGANATITLSPSGSGTVNINPVTTGHMNNVQIGNSDPDSGFFTLGNFTANSGGYVLQVQNNNTGSGAGAVAGFSASNFGILAYSAVGVFYSLYGNGALFCSTSGQFGTTLRASGAVTFDSTVTIGGPLSFISIPNYQIGYAGGYTINVTSASPLDLYYSGALCYRLWSNQFLPQVDNNNYLGNSGNRWFAVWAATGTIQTSDENEKQDLRALNTAEKAVAVRLKALLTMYRWKDQVAADPNAKLYCGIIAQRVEEAFTAEGLDPNAYALWRKDELGETMPGTSDDEGNMLTPPHFVGNGTFRYSVDYSQILAFIISAL